MPTKNNNTGSNSTTGNKTKRNTIKQTPIVTKGQSRSKQNWEVATDNAPNGNWQGGAQGHEQAPAAWNSPGYNQTGGQNWSSEKGGVVGNVVDALRGAVQNPFRAEFASDNIILDDPSMIQDVLTTQKTLIKGYGIAICEGSNQKFRSILGKHLTELAEDQFESFMYMQDRNLYPTEQAPAPKLTQAKERFKSKEETMNITNPRRS